MSNIYDIATITLANLSLAGETFVPISIVFGHPSGAVTETNELIIKRSAHPRNKNLVSLGREWKKFIKEPSRLVYIFLNRRRCFHSKSEYSNKRAITLSIRKLIKLFQSFRSVGSQQNVSVGFQWWKTTLETNFYKYCPWFFLFRLIVCQIAVINFFPKYRNYSKHKKISVVILFMEAKYNYN